METVQLVENDAVLHFYFREIRFDHSTDIKYFILFCPTNWFSQYFIFFF